MKILPNFGKKFPKWQNVEVFLKSQKQMTSVFAEYDLTWILLWRYYMLSRCNQSKYRISYERLYWFWFVVLSYTSEEAVTWHNDFYHFCLSYPLDKSIIPLGKSKFNNLRSNLGISFSFCMNYFWKDCASLQFWIEFARQADCIISFFSFLRKGSF